MSTADKITKNRFSVHAFSKKEVKAWHRLRIKSNFNNLPIEEFLARSFKELKSEFREYP